MPRKFPDEVRRQIIDVARSGTRVAQLVDTFGVSQATIYNWLTQEKIDRGEIEVVYQPQWSCADDSLSGAEALARWNHPRLGRIGAGARAGDGGGPRREAQ